MFSAWAPPEAEAVEVVVVVVVVVGHTGSQAAVARTDTHTAHFPADPVDQPDHRSIGLHIADHKTAGSGPHKVFGPWALSQAADSVTRVGGIHLDSPEVQQPIFGPESISGRDIVDLTDTSMLGAAGMTP